MEKQARKDHWQKVYTKTELHQVGWYQPIPTTSLDLIDELGLQSSAAIIDIGGGDSFLAENLLRKGFGNLSVLDISQRSIERAQQRMGNESLKVKWLNSDIVDFRPERKYDLWHDRAAFHFLRSDDDINTYIKTMSESINSGGYAIIGTFSENGPTKCSGLDITQYSFEKLNNLVKDQFELIRSLNVDHTTPRDVIQNFNFCVFRKK